MFSLRTTVLMLAIVPATLAAQRGGGGRGGGGRMGGDDASRGTSQSLLRLSNNDVEEMSPIKRLIDKRKDLKLSDAQVKQFKDLETAMKQRNEPMFRMLDSLRKDMTPGSSQGQAGFEKIANDRLAVSDLVGNIRLSYNETLKRATELLDDSQKQKADELMQQLNQETEKTLQEKLGGRNGDDGRQGRPPAP